MSLTWSFTRRGLEGAAGKERGRASRFKLSVLSVLSGFPCPLCPDALPLPNYASSSKPCRLLQQMSPPQ